MSLRETASGEFWLVRPDRFELPTFWFVARRSIQLSYGRNRSSIAAKRSSAGELQGSNQLRGLLQSQARNAISAARFGLIERFVGHAHKDVGATFGAVGNGHAETRRDRISAPSTIIVRRCSRARMRSAWWAACSRSQLGSTTRNSSPP